MIFRKMKQNSKKNHFKKQIVFKLNCVEKGYKGEYFSFPKPILNDNSYIKFGGFAINCLNALLMCF